MARSARKSKMLWFGDDQSRPLFSHAISGWPESAPNTSRSVQPRSMALVAQLSRKSFAAMTNADQCSGRTGGGGLSASRLATPEIQSAGTADSNDVTSGFTARSRSISALDSGTGALTFKRSSPAILTVPPAA